MLFISGKTFFIRGRLRLMDVFYGYILVVIS